MSAHKIDDCIQTLASSKTTIRCEELRAYLVALGFEVRDGKQGGHKVFVHRGLPDFTSGSYNCGHGRNPEIKPAYIKNVIRILKQYKDQLEDFIGR